MALTTHPAYLYLQNALTGTVRVDASNGYYWGGLTGTTTGTFGVLSNSFDDIFTFSHQVSLSAQVSGQSISTASTGSWYNVGNGGFNQPAISLTANFKENASSTLPGISSGIGRWGDEIFNKFQDGTTISADFVRRSLSSIRGNSAILPVEWSDFSEHTFFNSAELKTQAAIAKIVEGYPVGLSGASVAALGPNDLINYENFLFTLNGFEKYVLNYLGGVTGNTLLNPNPVLTASATSIGGVVTPVITLGRDQFNNLTGQFVSLSSNLVALAQSFDAGLNTIQLVSGTAADFNIVYFDDGSYYSNRILPQSRIEYVNRQSNMTEWVPVAYSVGDTEENLKLYMSTIGQIFDDTKLYIDQFANVNHISYDDFDRYPDGRIPTLIAKHFGFELIDTLARQDLSSYLRIDSTKVPLYQIAYKLWNRILNNLIYLYKKKGTLEAVQSLIRIYGIPDDYLQINDYNFHPEPMVATRVDYKNVRVLQFGTSSNDAVVFSPSLSAVFGPAGDFTVGTRVQFDSLPPSKNALFTNGLWGLSVNNAGAVSFTDGVGTATVSVGASILENYFVDIYGTRVGSTVSVYAGYLDDTSGSGIVTILSSTASTGGGSTVDNASTYVANGGGGSVFKGRMHELQFFYSGLSQADIQERVRNFESISFQNSPGTTFAEVVGEWKMKENEVLSGSAFLVNSWTLSSSVTASGQGSLTSTNQYVMEEAMRKETRYTAIGEFANDNVNIFVDGDVTSTYRKSNTLNIGFNPVDKINADILNVYGNFNASDVIGDPANFLATVSGYPYTYPVESISAGPVFSRWAASYPGAKIEFNDYIDALENLSPLIEGIMQGIQQLVPARTVFVNRGVVIEQHLLESSRVHTNPPFFEPELVASGDITYPFVAAIDDEYEVAQTIIDDLSWSGNPVSTADYSEISEHQLPYLGTYDSTYNGFRSVGNTIVQPFEQKVYNPSSTQLNVQFNRQFLVTDSTIDDWTTTLSGTIFLQRASTGKIITSEEDAIRLVIPCSTSGNPVSAVEHWFNVYVNGIMLDDTTTAFDFTVPKKTGLPVMITRKSKFLDQRIGFLTLQITNLLSGAVGNYTFLVSVNESGIGGSVELKTEITV